MKIKIKYMAEVNQNDIDVIKIKKKKRGSTEKKKKTPSKIAQKVLKNPDNNSSSQNKLDINLDKTKKKNLIYP